MSIIQESSGASKPRIAFLTPANPIDADSGGKQFTLDRLTSLSAIADMDVFCLEDSIEERQRLSKVIGGQHVYSAGVLKQRTVRRWVESIFHRVPLSVWRNDVSELTQLIEKHRDTHYDLIYVDHWLMWPASLHFGENIPRILNLHNAEHLIFERAAHSHAGIMKTLLNFEASRVRQYLKEIGQKAVAVHAISEIDRQELAALGIPASRITAILPCVDSDIQVSGQSSGRILFAGTLSWAPNVEGLEWFLRHVLPDLPIANPVQIVGGEPPEVWRHLPAADKVEFLGRVPSVEPLYATATLMIAPVFAGSGIKLKIVNSLARGLPVVTTRCGIEGFPPGWEKAVRVCDDPNSFGRAICDILDNPSDWSDTSRHAKQYATEHFSTEAARSKLKESLNACLSV